MLDEIESKTVHKEEGDQLRKKQGEWPSGFKGVVIRIRRFPVQTPLCAQLGLGTQLCYKVPGTLWVQYLKK